MAISRKKVAVKQPLICPNNNCGGIIQKNWVICEHCGEILAKSLKNINTRLRKKLNRIEIAKSESPIKENFDNYLSEEHANEELRKKQKEKELDEYWKRK